MEPLAAFMGMILGILISAILWGLVAIPLKVDAKTDNQFKKDCQSMAHGSVDKSASNICVKDGKILFHK
jgi:hypothetical protein